MDMLRRVLHWLSSSALTRIPPDEFLLSGEFGADISLTGQAKLATQLSGEFRLTEYLDGGL